MTTAGGSDRGWGYAFALALALPTLLACKLIDHLTSDEAPEDAATEAAPTTSIEPEFQAPPAVTTPPTTPEAAPDAKGGSPPATDTPKGTGTGSKPDGKKDPGTKTGGTSGGDPKTPDPKTPDPKTPDPKTPDPKTPDPKTPDAGSPKDAGVDLPKVPSKECLAKCNESLQGCVKVLGPNGLPNVEACRQAFENCRKACQ